MFSGYDAIKNLKVNNKYIEERVIKATNCKSRKYFSKNEQFQLINNLINETETMLYEHMRNKTRECLFTLYQMLDYNFYLTMVFIRRNQLKNSEKDLNDSFTEMILYSLDLHGKFDFNKEIDGCLLQINNLLSEDNQAMQKAITFIVANMDTEIQIKSYEEVSKSFDVTEMNDLLNIARTLYRYLIMLDMITANKIKLVKVANGMLTMEFKQKFQRLQYIEYENMLEYSVEKYNNECESKKEDLIKSELGLTSIEILKVIDCVFMQWKVGLKNIFFEKSSFMQKLNLEGFESENFNKFWTYFVLGESYKRNSSFSSEKSSKKSIIKYKKDIYYVSLYLLIINLIRLF